MSAKKRKNLFIQQSRIYRKTCLLPCVYAAAESGGVQDIEKGGTGYARLGELIGTAHIEQDSIGVGTKGLTEVKGIELVGFRTAHTGGKQGNERKGKEFLWFHLLAVG